MGAQKNARTMASVLYVVSVISMILGALVALMESVVIGISAVLSGFFVLVIGIALDLMVDMAADLKRIKGIETAKFTSKPIEAED